MNIVRYEVDRPKSLILNTWTDADKQRSWSVDGALEIQSFDPVYSVPVCVYGNLDTRTEIRVADFEIHLLTRNTPESWFRCDTETPFLYTFISEFAPFGTIKPQFLRTYTEGDGAQLAAAFARIKVLPKYRGKGIGTTIIQSLPEIAQLCAGIPPADLSLDNIDFLSISASHVSDKPRAAQWLGPLGYSWASKRNHRWLVYRTTESQQTITP